jgi:hypothetical protein
MNEKERKALEEVVRKLLIAVKEQEEKVGYLFWRHN